MAASWFDAYDSVGGAARFDTAAIPAAPSPSLAPATGAGFWSTNGATLAKVVAALGAFVVVWSLQHDDPAATTKVVTVPAVTVSPAVAAQAVAQIPVIVPQLAPAVTVTPQAPTPAPVAASVGPGDTWRLYENVCGNASTGYRMCRGSHRNDLQEALNWPPVTS